MNNESNTDPVEQKTIRQGINDIILHLQDTIPDINRMDKIDSILGASRVNSILRTVKNGMIPALEEKLMKIFNEKKEQREHPDSYEAPEYLVNDQLTEEKTFKQELNHLTSILTYASIDAHSFDVDGGVSNIWRIKYALHEIRTVLIPNMSRRVTEFKKAAKARNHNVSSASLKNLKPPVKKDANIE